MSDNNNLGSSGVKEEDGKERPSGSGGDETKNTRKSIWKRALVWCQSRIVYKETIKDTKERSRAAEVLIMQEEVKPRVLVEPGDICYELWRNYCP